METANIALLSDSPKVSFADIAKVAGAVTRQVNDHFYRYWQVRASLTPYATQTDVPLGYWRVTIIQGRPEGVPGLHRDNNGESYALVSDEDHWSVAVSHEVLEMLVDPTFSTYRAGYLPNGKRVNFLVEVCDPCQSSAYPVNGVSVSDFVKPSYFDPDPVEASLAGATYSFNGSISRPRSVAPYGYLVWFDPSDGSYYAFTSDGQTGREIPLGHFPGGLLTTREWVDSILRRGGIPLSPATQKRLEKMQVAHDAACRAHAERWIAETTTLIKTGHAVPPKPPVRTGKGKRNKKKGR